MYYSHVAAMGLAVNCTLTKIIAPTLMYMCALVKILCYLFLSMADVSSGGGGGTSPVSLIFMY